MKTITQRKQTTKMRLEMLQEMCEYEVVSILIATALCTPVHICLHVLNFYHTKILTDYELFINSILNVV